MKDLFADSAYWIAIINPHDALNARAREVKATLRPFGTIRSEGGLAARAARPPLAGGWR